MRRRPAAAGAALLVAGLLAGGGCRRPPEPARPAATPASGGLDTPEARKARQSRAEAVAALPAQPGVAVESCPLLLEPDFGAPQTGTLEAGATVEVLLVEPGFYGIRRGEKDLVFVPARSVRLLPGRVPTAAAEVRPRHEIVPEIVPLGGESGTPVPGTGTPIGTGTPVATETPTAGGGR